MIEISRQLSTIIELKKKAQIRFNKKKYPSQYIDFSGYLLKLLDALELLFVGRNIMQNLKKLKKEIET